MNVTLSIFFVMIKHTNTGGFFITFGATGGTLPRNHSQKNTLL